MAGIKPPLPRAYPVFRYASAVAAFLFFFSYLFSFVPRLNMSFGAAAPAAMEVAVGGGAPEEPQRNQSGGGCDSCTAEPTLMAEAPMAPSEKLAPEPQATLAAEAEMQELQQNQADSAEVSPVESRPFLLSLSPFQAALLALTVLAGLAALLIRLRTERAFARKNKAG
jgi:hypothetical protein